MKPSLSGKSGGGVQECAVSFAFVVFRGGAVPTFRENKREWKDISNIRDGKKREKETGEKKGG